MKHARGRTSHVRDRHARLHQGRCAGRLSGAVLGALLLTVTLATAGCSVSSAPRGSKSTTPTPTATASAQSSDAPAGTAEATPSPGAGETTGNSAAGAVQVKVVVRGDRIKTPAKRVKVKRGQPVMFLIDADRSGGLHVHSSPEQSIDFPKGTSTLMVRIDKPGVVDVEEHEADSLVAQLEVR